MAVIHYSLNHGYILSIANLRCVLAGINQGSRRWWIENNVTLLCDPDKPTLLADALPLRPCAEPDDRRDPLSGAGVVGQRGPMERRVRACLPASGDDPATHGGTLP
jgi:hypothetical protein